MKKKNYKTTFCWYDSNIKKESVTRTNLDKHSNFILSEADIKKQKPM